MHTETAIAIIMTIKCVKKGANYDTRVLGHCVFLFKSQRYSIILGLYYSFCSDVCELHNLHCVQLETRMSAAMKSTSTTSDFPYQLLYIEHNTTNNGTLLSASRRGSHLNRWQEVS